MSLFSRFIVNNDSFTIVAQLNAIFFELIFSSIIVSNRKLRRHRSENIALKLQVVYTRDILKLATRSATKMLLSCAAKYTCVNDLCDVFVTNQRRDVFTANELEVQIISHVIRLLTQIPALATRLFLSCDWLVAPCAVIGCDLALICLHKLFQTIEL